MGLIANSIAIISLSVSVYLLCKRHARPRLHIRIEGTTAPGFESLKDVFRSHFESGVEEAGAAYAAYSKGELVADLWGGWADLETATPWQQNTRSLFYSTTKGMGSLCLAMLVEKGKVKYEDLVTKYWKEFGQEGKDNVTVGMLASHQAGILSLGEPYEKVEDFGNFERNGKLLAKRKPSWPPGREFGYHTFTHGILIDQIVRRVDSKGRSVGEFFKEEIADPCGIEFSIGTSPSIYHSVARSYPNTIRVENVFTLLKLLKFVFSGGSPHLEESIEDIKTLPKVNAFMSGSQVLAQEQPSFSGVGTARGVAKLYNILVTGGICDGRKTPLLSAKIVKALNKPAAIPGGESVDLVLGKLIPNVRFSTQGFFILDTPLGNHAFGSPGYGIQDGFGDDDNKLAWSYLTNTIMANLGGDLSDPRSESLRKELYRIVEQKRKV